MSDLKDYAEAQRQAVEIMAFNNASVKDGVKCALIYQMVSMYEKAIKDNDQNTANKYEEALVKNIGQHWRYIYRYIILDNYFINLYGEKWITKSAQISQEKSENLEEFYYIVGHLNKNDAGWKERLFNFI